MKLRHFLTFLGAEINSGYTGMMVRWEWGVVRGGMWNY
jgi:hypothetical protein